MLKEAIEQLVKYGADSKPEVIPVNRELALICYGGKHEEIDPRPSARSHEVESLSSFIDAVSRWGVPGTSTIWHDASQVKLLIDDDERRDYVRLPVGDSEAFSLISDLDDQKFNHEAFCRLLRCKLNGIAPSDLLAKVRKIDFLHNATTRGEVQTTKRAFGKSVEDNVTAAADLPDQVMLVTRLTNVPGMTDLYQIPCVLDVDVRQEQFAIMPLLGSESDAIAK